MCIKEKIKKCSSFRLLAILFLLGVPLFFTNANHSYAESTASDLKWWVLPKPVITNIRQEDNSIVVTVAMDTGKEGATSIKVYMYEGHQKLLEEKLTTKNEKTGDNEVIFYPKESGNYSFKVLAERQNEIMKKESDHSFAFPFSMPLRNPELTELVFENGNVRFCWESIKETEYYIIKYRKEKDKEWTQSGKLNPSNQELLSNNKNMESSSIGNLLPGEAYEMKIIATRKKEASESAVYRLVISDNQKKKYWRAEENSAECENSDFIPLSLSLSKDAYNHADWDTVIWQIKETCERNEKITQHIALYMNGETKLVPELLQAVQGKNLLLTVYNDENYSCQISGRKIKKSDKAVTYTADFEKSTIPEKLIKKLLSEAESNGAEKGNNKNVLGYKVLHMEQSGELGLQAKMSLSLSALGMTKEKPFVAVYVYDKKSRSLILDSIQRPDENEKIVITTEKGRDYVLLACENVFIDANTKKSIKVTVKNGYVKVSYPSALKKAALQKLVQPKISYACDNKAVVSISGKGKLNEKKSGKAVITVTLELGKQTFFLEKNYVVKK